MKKKVIIITFTIVIILTAILIIGFNIKKNNKKNEVENVKVEVKKGEKVEEPKEEKKESDKNEPNNENRNESIQDNQSDVNSNNNSNSNVHQNDMEVNSVVDSNVPVNNEQSAPPVNNEPVSNSGPWDAFGMSEYDYYNKPMYSWERVDFSSMNDCINYGENYEPYKNGLELYNCRYVTSASGNTLGVMFDTEKLN